MRREYNKLVRDKIPQIIERNGEKPICRVLGPEEYREQLCRKLREEMDEFLEENSPEELADLYEVADALAQLLGGKEKIAELQRRKRETNDAFEKRVFLESVINEG